MVGAELVATFEMDDAVIGMIVDTVHPAMMNAVGVARGIFLVDRVKFASRGKSVGEVIALLPEHFDQLERIDAALQRTDQIEVQCIGGFELLPDRCHWRNHQPADTAGVQFADQRHGRKAATDDQDINFPCFHVALPEAVPFDNGLLR